MSRGHLKDVNIDMRSIDYDLNIFKVPAVVDYYRRWYLDCQAGQIRTGIKGVDVYEVNGNELFENIPETGDEKYETGEPWSKYWEDVTGGTWPTKCQRVGCACEGKGDAVGGHVWLSGGILDPYHMWIAPICQHTNKQGEDRRFRLNPSTLLAQVDLRYVVKKSE